MSRCLTFLLAILFAVALLAHKADSTGFMSIQPLQFIVKAPIAGGGGGGVQFLVTADHLYKDGKKLFYYKQSGRYRSTNRIEFGSAFGELSSPFAIDLGDSQEGFWLQISAIGGTDDGQPQSRFTAWLKPNGAVAVRLLNLISSSNSTLALNYWYSCDANYFGPQCRKYCRGGSSPGDGYSWCDSKGEKTCLYGWIDASSDCKRPHPCRTCACQFGGTCVPSGDNYTCLCPPSYRGVNCEQCDPGAEDRCPRQAQSGSGSSSSCDLFAVQEAASKDGGFSIGIAGFVGSVFGALLGGVLLGAVLLCAVAMCCSKNA